MTCRLEIEDLGFHMGLIIGKQANAKRRIIEPGVAQN